MDTQATISQEERGYSIENVEPVETETEAPPAVRTYRCRAASRRLHDEGENDEILMTKVSGGDARALEKLFDRHAGVIKSVIFKIIHNEAEAEDVLMEVFFEAWNNAPK